MGGSAAKLIYDKKFGRMVSVKGTKITDVSLEDVAGKLRLVQPNDPIVIQGKRMGICFGKK